MPLTSGGREGATKLPAGMQLITFSIEQDDDQRFEKWIEIKVPRNQSIDQVAARRGHPEDARRIAQKNSVRSVNRILWKKQKPGAMKGRKNITTIKVPGELRASNVLHAIAGDDPPRIVSGYAKFSTIDRPERAGIAVFDGYDPIEMAVPIRFEAKTLEAARQLEDDIDLLERMAGRGAFSGAAVGPPPIIRLSTTDGEGSVLPLIPRSYQWSPQNKTARPWRIAGIDWDQNPLRNRQGNRTRQLATVTVREHVVVNQATRSVTKRMRMKQGQAKSSRSKKGGRGR